MQPYRSCPVQTGSCVAEWFEQQGMHFTTSGMDSSVDKEGPATKEDQQHGMAETPLQEQREKGDQSGCEKTVLSYKERCRTPYS